MCQKNYNIEDKQKKEYKYKHLNYTEKTQIERMFLKFMNLKKE